MAVFNKKFYRVNSNNLALTQTPNGGTANQPTEEIFSLALRTGTISCSTSSTTVTGSGTQFSTQLQVGHILQDAIGNNIGVVASITAGSETSLTLVSSAKITLNGARFASGNVDAVLPTDSFLMRIEVIKASGNTSVTVPSLFQLRRGTSEEVLSPPAFTNKSYIEFFAEGALGIGDVSATPVSLEAGIENYSTVNLPNIASTAQPFPSIIASGLAQMTVANFPTYCWYLINPFARGVENLATNTKYGFEITDDLPAIVIPAANITLQASHYDVVNQTYFRKY
jgi:hypothetical protein